ncbi:ATP synthase subunit b 2 [Agaricicola taiwanensis]|uniref:ATP synthase subunit b n=1 Tax=Agaricicola taiwanensis TaxID=591372 RepID=A0A8J2VNT9_9RHOB|nr:F0F1 ATP synthase subunit B [Agaricicola taiwanensis]GGE34838.1 ATP synthase subunit b 2 [Agaricicola taiwanensis]
MSDVKTQAIILAQGDPAVPPIAAEERAATSELQDSAHGGSFPPFESETFASQILWLALTFGALYFLMAKVALPRVGSILEVRRDRIASDLAEAQKLQDETQEAIAAYEQALAQARAKAQAIAAENHAKTAAAAEASRKEIEAALDEKLKVAEARITETKQAALGNVRSIAIDAAGAIVAQLTGTTPTADEVAGAVDAALAR